MGYLDKTGLNKMLTKLKYLLDNKSDLSHTHVYTRGVVTGGTSNAYTATIDGITSLEEGMTITIIPHTDSSSIMPTLNVNNLGAKTISIRDGASYSRGTTYPLYANWLSATMPVSLTYGGGVWIADLSATYTNELRGVVQMSSGGTGAGNAADARANLGITSGTSAPPSTGAEGSIYIQYEE